MADQEHLEIIRQGPMRWDRWRRENPTLTPDLSRADLKSVDLLGANLTGANFTKANLDHADLGGGDLTKANLTRASLFEADLYKVDFSGANLTKAELRRANLTWANLTKANIHGADLTEADLPEADLTGANLTDASLAQANLTRANLAGASLSGAILFYTVFGNTNLTDALGLDECIYIGPSILDHLTLAQSGHLPLPFLRGCGLPDTLIDYLPSLLNQAIQFYSCFISYSTKDQEFAARLYADLQNKGVRCWFAPHDVQGGKKLHEQLERLLRDLKAEGQ